MFAPKHHGAMKHAIGPRREMAVRTIFNILGPLTNPASAPNQLLGVFDHALVEPLARVMQQLGSRHVMVVHAEDGMDEISISAPTAVAELHAGSVSTYTIQPEDFGLQRAPIEAIRVDGVEQSLEVIRAVLEGKPGPARDIVLLNAGAALYVAGLAASHREGVALAQQAIDSDAAAQVLQNLVQQTNS